MEGKVYALFVSKVESIIEKLKLSATYINNDIGNITAEQAAMLTQSVECIELILNAQKRIINARYCKSDTRYEDIDHIKDDFIRPSRGYIIALIEITTTMLSFHEGIAVAAREADIKALNQIHNELEILQKETLS